MQDKPRPIGDPEEPPGPNHECFEPLGLSSSVCKEFLTHCAQQETSEKELQRYKNLVSAMEQGLQDAVDAQAGLCESATRD